MARKFPSATSAVVFGVVAALVAYVQWIPAARAARGIVFLSLGVGAAHALSAAFLAPALLREEKALTPGASVGRGALVSLVAIVLFSPAFAAWVASPPASVRGGLLGFVSLSALVGLFGFLAAGWAIVAACAALGWLLNLTTRSA